MPKVDRIKTENNPKNIFFPVPEIKNKFDTSENINMFE